MSTIAKEGKKIDPLPVGNYPAVCFDVWDIGLQKGVWKGVPNVLPKVVIGWEVNEKIKSEDKYNGKRYCVYGWFTLSLGKKANLRKQLTSWRGKEFTPEELKGFDLDNLIGANCLLNIIHNEEGNAKISSITPLMKGMEKMEPENKRSEPDWVKKKRAEAVSEEEARRIEAESSDIQEEMEPITDEKGDEIPF